MRTLERFLVIIFTTLFGILLPVTMGSCLYSRTAATLATENVETMLLKWSNEGKITEDDYLSLADILVKTDYTDPVITVSGISWGTDSQVHEITYEAADVVLKLQSDHEFIVPAGFKITFIAFRNKSIKSALSTVFGTNHRIAITVSQEGGVYIER